MVACGRPRRLASTTPVCACPWSSDCSPVRIEVESLVAHGVGQRIGRGDAVGAPQRVVVTWMARSAPRASASRMTGCDARGTRGADDHFPAVLLPETQPLLERVRVGLIELPTGVLLAYGSLVVGQPRLPLARWDLFDAHRYFHMGHGATEGSERFCHRGTEVTEQTFFLPRRRRRSQIRKNIQEAFLCVFNASCGHKEVTPCSLCLCGHKEASPCSLCLCGHKEASPCSLCLCGNKELSPCSLCLCGNKELSPCSLCLCG